MKHPGQIALMPFPYTNLANSKRRPVLLLRKLNNSQDDWLVCMVSSQLRQADPDLDWVLHEGDSEFPDSGLKVASVFRLSRIAVLDGALLLGSLGHIPDERLQDLRGRLGSWIIGVAT
ncbi:type II toxin-antitoxin system PemK/MazF family toxin [Marinobacter sp.]|uniref:type II toxin-antitoxin system PemK/MazF family toxin n=1 Tax=Marinobacter sp. TaxID=50741 RepID=UPI001996378D|nr:type II toxin-antitoxin system PemK/MazF family toxin [Marinobacter sp.]MBD3655355.1 type II toxin-antitoxin system PemK/MazF family toxin [Marinobacter sp.]